MSEWNQRRTCLEASVKDYRQEIEETRRGKSHDEIVASDREQVCPLTYFSVCFFMIKINEKQWPPTYVPTPYFVKFLLAFEFLLDLYSQRLPCH